MTELRPNTQRAKNAVLLIWIVLILTALSLVSSLMQYDLLNSADPEYGVDFEAAQRNDLRESIIASLSLIALIISVVTFLQWFRRAYYNLHQISDQLKYAEGWAVGSWFVPILNLYRPYRIMRELYYETGRKLFRMGVRMRERNTINYIGWWWALWILTAILGQVQYRYSKFVFNIEGYKDLTLIEISESLFSIPLSLLIIKIIKDYSKMERQLADLISIEEITGTEENPST